MAFPRCPANASSLMESDWVTRVHSWTNHHGPGNAVHSLALLWLLLSLPCCAGEESDTSMDWAAKESLSKWWVEEEGGWMLGRETSGVHASLAPCSSPSPLPALPWEEVPCSHVLLGTRNANSPNWRALYSEGPFTLCSIWLMKHKLINS